MGWSHHVYRLLIKAGLFWEDPKYEQRLLFAIAATNPAKVYDVCHQHFCFWNRNHSPCKVAGSRDRRDHMIRAPIMCTVRDHMITPTTPSTLFCMLSDNWNWPKVHLPSSEQPNLPSLILGLKYWNFNSQLLWHRTTARRLLHHLGGKAFTLSLYTVPLHCSSKEGHFSGDTTVNTSRIIMHDHMSSRLYRLPRPERTPWGGETVTTAPYHTRYRGFTRYRVTHWHDIGLCVPISVFSFDPISGHVACDPISGTYIGYTLDIGSSCHRHRKPHTWNRDHISGTISGVTISVTWYPDIGVNIGYQYRVSRYRGW